MDQGSSPRSTTSKGAARKEAVASGDGLPNSAYRVESLAKGLSVLALFAERTEPLRLSEIAELTGIPMPTTYRLVHTLHAEGFLDRVADGALRPGPRVLALGFAALRGLDIVKVAADPLRSLARSTGQTVNLGVLRGDQVVYLERLRNSDLVTANLQVGSVAPAYCTSMGKLLLALQGGIPHDFDATDMGRGHGPKAARSRDELERMLARVRRDGWAVQDQEFAPGLRSVAGPIRDAAGHVVAAVNLVVQAPSWSVKAMLSDFLQPVLDTCADISQRLGAEPRR